jgi:hypothetical protein
VLVALFPLQSGSPPGRVITLVSIPQDPLTMFDNVNGIFLVVALVVAIFGHA